MMGLPGGGGAVLIVGVGVVVVHILPREDGGARGAAHGGGGERVGEVGPTLHHNLTSLIHGLHGAWDTERVGGRGRERKRMSILGV